MADRVEVEAKVKRLQDGMIYAEYRILNEEIADIAFHAKEFPFEGWKDAVEAYKETARQEVLRAVEEHFPGSYV